MKKTVTSNINGIVYHIDEDAYESLQAYLQTLFNHFANEDSSDEIMLDIEARISELLQLKMKTVQQVVTIADVLEIIKIMGTPEDFGIHNDTEKEEKKVDEQRSYKRLFRDTDERILGGVCSGIGYYFNVDVVIIRILFIISFFFAGPLLYIAAWILIPKAESTSQKIEMRGEKIDIESIKQRVKDEFEDVKSRFTDYRKTYNKSKKKERKYARNRREELKREKYNNYSQSDSCQSGQRSSSFFVLLGSYMFRIVMFFISIIILALVLALVFGFSLEWFDVSNFANLFPKIAHTWMEYIFSSVQQSNIAIVGLIIVLCLPLLLLVWGVFSIICGYRNNRKITGYIAFSIWFIAFCMLGYVGYHVIQDFNEKGIVIQQKSVLANPTKEFIINKKSFNTKIECVESPNNVKEFKHWAFIDCINDVVLVGIVDLEVKYVLQDSISVEIYETSRGKTKQLATDIAENINIKPNLTDSSLEIPRFFIIENPRQWRNQRVQVVVKLPESMKYKILENGSVIKTKSIIK
jgi:phage shock protein PspC (stress-responsive transcriptional regulator)